MLVYSVLPKAYVLANFLCHLEREAEKAWLRALYNIYIVQTQRRYDTMTSRAIIADSATTSQWRFPYITTKVVVPQPNELIQLLTYTVAFQNILYRSRYEAPRKPTAHIHNTSVKFSFPYTPLIAAKAPRM